MIYAALGFLAFPAILIFLGLRSAWVDRLGLVLLCFASGILLNSIANMTGAAEAFNALQALQTQLTELCIALALPLLVMSIDLHAAVRHASQTLKATCLAFLSVLVTSFGLSFLFADSIDQLWQVAGLAVGAYTGGGPNMAAINTAIEGDQAVFVRMTSYDIFLSAMYLLFAISIAKPLFRKLLPEFEQPKTTDAATDRIVRQAANEDLDNSFEHLGEENSASYAEITHKQHFFSAISSIVIAIIVLGLSVSIASMLPDSLRSAGTIILITSLGMLASLIPAVRKLKISFRLGMYLVLVFCFTMGSMTNLSLLANLDMALFAYIGLMLIIALLMHALLCRAFKVDVDTFLVTASASIMSVPFIPVIVGALRNPALLVPGFAAAIIGYVIGNYLGIAVAFACKALL